MSGRVVVVTGAARGIGRAVANAFANRGDRLIRADIRDGEFTVDVADEASVQRFFSGLDRVDVLINNAGIHDVQPMAERSMESWHRILAVNLTGPYLCVRHALPLMPDGSAIINIASTRAFMSEPDTEPYSASKGGLIALTHSLAVSLAPRRIRVNAISPGWIDVSDGGDDLRPVDHEQHPAGRVGRPEDIAEACLFLADPKAAGFITGTSLTIDGGMTIKMIYA